MASQLREVGYRTAMYGKWHAGNLPNFSPIKSGWEHFIGCYGGTVDYFSKINRVRRYDWYDGEEQITDNRYFPDIVAEQAIAFLERQGEDPWLLNLNFSTPHYPWMGPGDKAVSDELTARVLAGGGNTHHDGGSIQTFAAMVEHMDSKIGEVLTALRRTGQRSNTVVLFMSDNGGERFSYMWPLSGEKTELREGGIRVPAFVSWPSAIRPNQVCHDPVYTIDWTATVYELSGVQPSLDLDGVSLVDSLNRGSALPERDMFWRMRGQRALRRGNLKYLQMDGTEYLFDLATDVHEQANLVARRPSDLSALRQAWEAIDAELLPYS